MLLEIPNHVGIIVDGNGRWASERGLSRSAGHKEGSKNLDKLVEYAFSKGIKYISLYVFSTENFKRSDEEVNFLMEMIEKKFKSDINKFIKNEVRVLISGRRDPLNKNVLKVLDEVQAKTAHFTEKTVNFCLNYGGCSEIVDASKKIHEALLKNEITEINEETFNKYLYNNLPPLDFVIRTSGESRISNFMLYQAAYAEFYFPKTYFPDFKEKDFDEAILEYNKRNRRFGGINYEGKN